MQQDIRAPNFYKNLVGLFSLDVVEARQELGPLQDEPDGPTAAQEKEDDPRQGVAREVAPPDVVGGAVVG